jgi:hypothetical protein
MTRPTAGRSRTWNDLPAFAVPIVREIPRPVGPNQFGAERW